MENIICPYCGEISKDGDKICFECDFNLLLNEKYYLLDVLGENNGITYLAKEIKTDQKVVIKELVVKKIERWKIEELFLREGKVLKSLNHKNIPKLLDQFTTKKDRDVNHYIVMEYIQGVSLSKLMDKKRYREGEILNILKNILETLNYLHNLHPSIIHRDIKPSNLILKEDNSIAIIDFGGVKDIIKPFMGSTVAGTFGYTAPEQLMGKAEKRSDYYSVGMTIVSLLIGETPEKYIERGIYYLKNNLNLSDKLLNIIKKLTDQDKNKRYKNITQILNDIDKDSSQFDKIKGYNKLKNKTTILDISERERVISQYIRLKKDNIKKVNKNRFIKGISIAVGSSLVTTFLHLNDIIQVNSISFYIIITSLFFAFTKVSDENFFTMAEKITKDYELIYLVYSNENPQFDDSFNNFYPIQNIDKTKVKIYKKIVKNIDIKKILKGDK